MSKKLSNVLRVTPSFASHTNPGSGTNSYFHSKYSKYKSYVLTEDRGLKYLEVGDNVKIKKVKTLNKGLGEVGDRKFFLNLIYKVFSTFIFTVKSIGFLHSVKPQIVHLYSPIYLITGLYCKVFFGSKVVLSIHGTDGLRIQKFKFLRLIFKLVDLNLSLSKKFIENINRKDIQYLGNGFDNSLFYLFNKENDNRDEYIITVGNLRWQKDHKSMIEAFHIFHKLHRDYKLIIIGEGELRNELEKQIQELNLQDSISLKGKRDQKYIAELMNRSELFFLSSTTEGSPKVIYEAMACGLPILSTNVGDVNENTTNETSVIVDVDVNAMAEGLSEILDNKFDRIFISEDVKKKSWKFVSEKLDRIYEGIK